MTYQNPDPFNPRNPNSDRRPLGGSSGFNATWGWIAGAVVIVLLLMFIFGQSGTSNDVNNSPAAPQVTAPANSTAQAPASTPAQTTGQAQ